ncbi:MAG: NUDIX hydrolase [Solirubrobacteraceae bacterium]
MSYGGVVVRGDEMIVIVPRGRRRVLGLPKGGPMEGETPEQTAAREVREETGITARVRERLGQVDYTYRRGGRNVAKTVHFYLCLFEAGDTADHDHEVDDARWMPLREARRRLSYPGERAMVERALSVLRPNG